MLILYKLYESQESEKLLAEIVEFDDGQVVVKWCGDVRSLVIFKNLDEFKTISLYKGRQLCKCN